MIICAILFLSNPLYLCRTLVVAALCETYASYIASKKELIVRLNLASIEAPKLRTEAIILSFLLYETCVKLCYVRFICLLFCKKYISFLLYESFIASAMRPGTMITVALYMTYILAMSLPL